MNKVYLHTGTNIGDRTANLLQANTLIKSRIGDILQASRIYQTAAWGIEDQPDFLNQALLVESKLSAREILLAIAKIEQEMGRIRVVRWGERLIDIDILFFNDEIIQEEDLQIPHPELQNRNFVLRPLMDFASALMHPVLGQTITDLWQECQDPLEASIYEPNKKSGITGHEQ